MQTIRISPFYGTAPRVADRLLQDGRAVEATNLVLTSGEIRPIKQPLPVFKPDISPPYLSVYRAETIDETEKWLAFNKDVNVVRAPLATSVEPRFYLTGNNEPRYAKFSMLPASYYSLGIPKPQTKPGVSSTGGTGITVTRVYVYTFFSDLGEESAPSPVSMLTSGLVDGSWSITDMDAFPSNSGSGSATVSMGVTTFTNTGFHWLRKGEEILLGGMSVLVESTPSPSMFTVTGDFSASTSWSRVAFWNTFGMKRRLYRNAGSTGSFQLVADDVGTSYTDTLSDAQILGDELISFGWELPPVNLSGLIALPNGSLVGFFDNQICYSEPYQPHAWPIIYRRATDFEVVGIESYGTSVVACTAGRPYLCEGQEPQFVTAESIDKVWPCLSKRSVISVGDGVMFATTYGMAYIGMGGSRIFTMNLFTRLEWQERSPNQMVAAYAEGRIFVRYASSLEGNGLMVFDLENPDIGLTQLSIYPDEIYSDPRNGLFYIADFEGVKQYDASEGVRLPYVWQSKTYHFNPPINFGAAKVDFTSEMSDADIAAAQMQFELAIAANQMLVDNNQGAGAINGSTINTLGVGANTVKPVDKPDLSLTTFTLYANDKPVFSKVLGGNSGPFRLPAGFKADSYSIGLTGTLQIKTVKIAETMTELRAL